MPFSTLRLVIVLNMWSDETGDIFISLWTEKPCLYDVGTKSYRVKRKQAVDEIATKLDDIADAI